MITVTSDLFAPWHKHNVISDSGDRTVSAYLLGTEGLIDIQTWTIPSTATDIQDLSGFARKDNVTSVWIGAVSGGDVFILPCLSAVKAVTYNSGVSNGMRLRVGDVLGPKGKSHRKENLYVLYGGDLGYAQTVSGTITNGSRAATAGVLDTRNIPARSCRVVFSGTPGATVTAGAITVEAYESTDGGSTYETSPSIAFAIAATASTAFRTVRELPPGKWKLDVFNQSGSNMTGFAINTNYLLE